jgi:uncharacterized protein YbjT (DUF2867 family)
MKVRVLVLGATGTLGRPVVRSLVDGGHPVHILTRSAEKARAVFGETVEAVEGNPTNRDHLSRALAGCEAVHVSLPTDSELIAVEHLLELAGAASGKSLRRISYISGTSVREENRWFDLIDVKMKAEERLRDSGVPHTVFCPTWVMEVLPNFVRPHRAVAITGKHPPGFHFFAAADFGRMVASSLEDDRALGRRLFVHGPEAITLPEAIRRYHRSLHPEVALRNLRVWQARLIARLTRQRGLAAAASLIGYFDKTEEHGDPSEANALLGAPSTTLNEWIQTQKGGGVDGHQETGF